MKAVYYTTEFVLKCLNLQESSDSESVACQWTMPTSEPYKGQKQSVLAKMTVDKDFKFDASASATKGTALYSAFFTNQKGRVPQENDLYELITRLLENFIKTFLYGRSTDLNKHFYKVFFLSFESAFHLCV